MTEFAIAVPFEAEQQLVAEAGRYGHAVVIRCSGADELSARVSALRPQAVLVVAMPQYLSAALIATCDSSGVPLVVIAENAEQQRHARALGVVDAAAGPVAWATLMRESGPVAAEPDVLEGAVRDPHIGKASRRGTVLTVWGPHGSPGRTSLAIAIAAELADAGLRVALGDADTHAASIDPALGLLDEAPGFAAACRLAGSGSLTVGEFERVAEWARSGHGGFWVLTGLGRPSRWPEVTAQRVEGVIEAARGWVDVLVLDTAASIEQDEELSSDVSAPRRNGATIAALRCADHVLAVAAADPIGLARYLRAHADLIETVAPDQVTTIVNKLRSSAIGLNPQGQVLQTLARFGGITDPVVVPWDPAAFDAAVLGGKPLRDAGSRSPARLAVRSLVRERLLPEGAGGRWRRGGRRAAG
jgi:Mrp family chromosome partitioning ATPase